MAERIRMLKKPKQKNTLAAKKKNKASKNEKNQKKLQRSKPPANPHAKKTIKNETEKAKMNIKVACPHCQVVGVVPEI